MQFAILVQLPHERLLAVDEVSHLGGSVFGNALADSAPERDIAVMGLGAITALVRNHPFSGVIAVGLVVSTAGFLLGVTHLGVHVHRKALGKWCFARIAKLIFLIFL